MAQRDPDPQRARFRARQEFADVHVETAPTVSRFAAFVVADVGKADEIVAEAYCELQGSGLRPADSASALPLLLAAVQRCARPAAARERPLVAVGTPAAASVQTVRDHGLIDAIRRLPGLEQQVIFLHLIEGWSSDETARALARTIPEVRSAQLRALRRLREILEPRASSSPEATA